MRTFLRLVLTAALSGAATGAAAAATLEHPNFKKVGTAALMGGIIGIANHLRTPPGPPQ